MLKYFTKRFDDVIKYNLDFESYVLEFKYLIYNENNYYITTPIYYPSAKPHMGHAY